MRISKLNLEDIMYIQKSHRKLIQKICDELVSECVAEYANGKPRAFAKEVIGILTR
jgi:hypothetical protein